MNASRDASTIRTGEFDLSPSCLRSSCPRATRRATVFFDFARNRWAASSYVRS